MSRREQIIAELLERLVELTDPQQARGKTGDGEHLPLMPATYTSSVRETERLLRSLRDQRRRDWWHLSERYLRSTAATKDVPVRLKAKNGKTAYVLERRVVIVFHPAVEHDRVDAGIGWIADNWGQGYGAFTSSEPMLPRELQVAA